MTREQELEVKLAKAVEALRFYGNIDNWSSHEHSYPSHPCIDEDDEELTNPHVWHSGKRAREALKEIGDE